MNKEKPYFLEEYGFSTLFRAVRKHGYQTIICQEFFQGDSAIADFPWVFYPFLAICMVVGTYDPGIVAVGVMATNIAEALK